VENRVQWQSIGQKKQGADELHVGELVTMNEHGKAGYENTVAIYDKKGHWVKSFHLDELITDEDDGQFSRSESSRWWNNKARY
jgi:hypothetical protein